MFWLFIFIGCIEPIAFINHGTGIAVYMYMYNDFVVCTYVILSVH